jgi:hypothetical protein
MSKSSLFQNIKLFILIRIRVQSEQKTLLMLFQLNFWK